MTITVLAGDPDARLADALMRFEDEFSYPLGDGARFRIAHDGDGWRFFHALGEAVYAIAHDDQRVLGVLGAALRQVVCPDGSTVPMLYVGDLKIAIDARGGRSLLRLARTIQERFQHRTQRSYAVVMDGTTALPTAYTGRVGIPAFAAAGAVAILWIRTCSPTTTVTTVDQDVGSSCFASLASGQFHMPHGDSALRSQQPPRWLVDPDGTACGRMEDTLRAKRLHSTNGEDMRSAHLSCFAYRTVNDGLRLLDSALALAASAGYPMVFTAVQPHDAERFSNHLGDRLRVLARATIFATGVPTGGRWLISTADI